VTLNELLARYGPETRSAREQLRRSVDGMVRQFWPSEATTTSRVTTLEHGAEIKRLREALDALTPASDAQRQLLAHAQQMVDDVAQSRWMVIERAQNKLPTPLLVILVFWFAVLFCSFGLFAPRNAMIFVTLFVCACSMAGAIFLILEMDRPLDGFIQ